MSYVVRRQTGFLKILPYDYFEDDRSEAKVASCCQRICTLKGVWRRRNDYSQKNKVTSRNKTGNGGRRERRCEHKS
ncbi:hypothetical protein HY772_04770 [Candidatus Woesearchaeota archaeon]|nr:hypothetical protein [Candidatus Woesearchaeota archaeon]